MYIKLKDETEIKVLDSSMDMLIFVELNTINDIKKIIESLSDSNLERYELLDDDKNIVNIGTYATFVNASISKDGFAKIYLRESDKTQIQIRNLTDTVKTLEDTVVKMQSAMSESASK